MTKYKLKHNVLTSTYVYAMQNTNDRILGQNPNKNRNPYII